MSLIAKHIVFTGRVQGVGFRFTALNVAKRYQLGGMVRNVMDGSVEMIAQGQPDEIDDCVRDIQDSLAGYIRETKIKEISFNPKYTTFGISF